MNSIHFNENFLVGALAGGTVVALLNSEMSHRAVSKAYNSVNLKNIIELGVTAFMVKNTLEHIVAPFVRSVGNIRFR